MEFQLIERAELNAQKWDELVERTPQSSVFSSSFYLDEVSENWCVLVNENYTTGLALPYSVRAKRKILYTPIFVSYLEVLGEKPIDYSEFQTIILAVFKTIEIEFKQAVLGESNDRFLVQLLPDNAKRKGQVNRMLNKVKRAELEIIQATNWEEVYAIVHAELVNKFSGMTCSSMKRLFMTYSSAQEKNLLRTFEIRRQTECVGGIICIEKNGKLLYSKGASDTDARDNGGMYAAIDAAITYASEHELQFDFGGSRVEGVRRFNVAFGGEDLEYYNYRIDNSPHWFRWVRKLKKRWSKKS